MARDMDDDPVGDKWKPTFDFDHFTWEFARDIALAAERHGYDRAMAEVKSEMDYLRAANARMRETIDSIHGVER